MGNSKNGWIKVCRDIPDNTLQWSGLLFRLYIWADFKTGIVNLSTRAMAKKMKTSQRTVARLLNLLQKDGYVSPDMPLRVPVTERGVSLHKLGESPGMRCESPGMRCESPGMRCESPGMHQTAQADDITSENEPENLRTKRGRRPPPSENALETIQEVYARVTGKRDAKEVLAGIQAAGYSDERILEALGRFLKDKRKFYEERKHALWLFEQDLDQHL